MLLHAGMLGELSDGTPGKLVLRWRVVFDRDKSSDSVIKLANFISGHVLKHLCSAVFA